MGDAPLAALSTAAPLPADLTDASSGVTKFLAINEHKLHMVLPKDDLNIPWTALLIGLWIPNFYYWGLNQYITQRVLGSASLREGQRGIVFAATLKLLIPFVVIFPGMIAFNLFSHDMKTAANEMNVPVLARFAVVKNQDTLVMELFTCDAHFTRANPALADAMERHNGQVQDAVDAGYGTVEEEHKLLGYRFDTAFGLLLGPVFYELLRRFTPEIAFLDRIAISYVALLLIMGLITWIAPRRDPVAVPTHTGLNLESSKSAKVGGVLVVIATVVLYVIFW